MSLMLIYNLGTRFYDTAEGYNGLEWTNPKTKVRGQIVFNSIPLPGPDLFQPIISAYAGPKNEGGNNWGGLASGYIEDRPAP